MIGPGLLPASSTQVTDIKNVVDTINGKVALDTTVAKELTVSKIDGLAVNGLAGVNNSLAYKVHELERHFHGYGKWFGAAAVPVGETHVADRMGPGILAFALLSGNNNFGNWVQVLGSSDTPVASASVYFDLHKVAVTSANDTNPFLVQIVSGENADIAAKLTAETFSEFPYEAATNQINAGSFDVLDRRFAVGTKMWMRCICIGSNAKTINLFVGLHEYEG